MLQYTVIHDNLAMLAHNPVILCDCDPPPSGLGEGAERGTL